MDAIRCDHCNRLTDEDPVFVGVLWKRPQGEEDKDQVTRGDLCGECAAEMEAFLDAGLARPATNSNKEA